MVCISPLDEINIPAQVRLNKPLIGRYPLGGLTLILREAVLDFGEGWGALSVKQVGSSAMAVRFGVFEANLRTRELRKKGQKIKLQEQPFQVLALLLERPGEMVTREELRHALWPADTFVDFEHGLNKAISKLRKALGDDGGTPRYIETLPRRGYRFIAPVTATNPVPEPVEFQAAPTTLIDLSDNPAHRRPRWMIPSAILTLVLLISITSWFLFRLTAKPPHPSAAELAASIRSIAVLPFQNLSGNKDQEYFADGMTDELITDLGQMGALRVISRTSVMHYKQTVKTIPEIDRELGVDAIVEGTVLRSGDRVRITAQLIDAKNDRHLWAREYARNLRDVIALQDEVARDIADEVRIELTPQERARLTAVHPVNPEAHEAYLRGRYYWNQFTQEGVKKSLPFFQKAIVEDPGYALGYSGLADYYSVSYVRFGILSRDEACPTAEASALKAIELDDSLAEGHHSLGGIRFFCDWDVKGAESEFKRALQLNPSYSEAHRVYSELLISTGRDREAVAEAERAVENDPMSGDINMVLGWAYYMVGRYDQAIQQERKTIEMDPRRPQPHYILGRVNAKEGQYLSAVQEFTKSAELQGEDPGTSPWVGYADALAGRRLEALGVLKRSDAMSTHRPFSALERALVYTGLGDKQHAFAWLEKAYQEHSCGLVSLNTDPAFDSLHSDPRFRDLVRRISS
jgi:TolB-like protein/DNA-binding winged helix-turn-helix (wHTH) protein/Flp pilus assembly protein TadD